MSEVKIGMLGLYGMMTLGFQGLTVLTCATRVTLDVVTGWIPSQQHHRSEMSYA